jgi:HSP20 family protein
MLRTPLFSDVITLRTTRDRVVPEVFAGSPFQTLWSRSGAGTGSRVAQGMPIDVYATDDHAMVLAAIPGMDPDELEITVHQNTLNLSGTVPPLTPHDESRDLTWYVHELNSGTYRRSVTLPFAIDADQVEATFDNGIVRVMLPKADRARPRRIAISTGARRAEAITAGDTGPGDQESSDQDSADA